jgi:hypothetical protein
MHCGYCGRLSGVSDILRRHGFCSEAHRRSHTRLVELGREAARIKVQLSPAAMHSGTLTCEPLHFCSRWLVRNEFASRIPFEASVPKAKRLPVPLLARDRAAKPVEPACHEIATEFGMPAVAPPPACTLEHQRESLPLRLPAPPARADLAGILTCGFAVLAPGTAAPVYEPAAPPSFIPDAPWSKNSRHIIARLSDDAGTTRHSQVKAVPLFFRCGADARGQKINLTAALQKPVRPSSTRKKVIPFVDVVNPASAAPAGSKFRNCQPATAALDVPWVRAKASSTTPLHGSVAPQDFPRHSIPTAGPCPFARHCSRTEQEQSKGTR